jgi:hypothetical protein
MITPLHFEVFASGMKARLDPTYRLVLQAHQRPGSTEILNLTRRNRITALPFTTITKSYNVFGR